VRIALHAEVGPRVTLNVARSEDEAARQARGEEVTGRAMEEAELEAEAAKRAAEKLFEEGTEASDIAEALEEATETEGNDT
ncbi:MAG: 50S ribosomal protein L9, partial [Methyloceanibacter sp.]